MPPLVRWMPPTTDGDQPLVHPVLDRGQGMRLLILIMWFYLTPG
jgi:hypothetical protein